MQTDTTIREGDRDGGLSINITPGQLASFLSLEIANPTTNDEVTIVIFTDNKTSFLEALKGATDECLLRIRDEEQTGERDDG